MQNIIEELIHKSDDRVSFCIELINHFNLSNVAELGVYKGDFAKQLLENSHDIEKYLMIDPWRNLDNWNKPANTNNKQFDQFYRETMQKTDFAKDKRIVLRGKTNEIIDEIEDHSIDFLYIDGDHTLRGITIDLISFWPKVKNHGFIVGDDFSPTIWQHKQSFEPTLVFPFAVYFAEAVKNRIYGLPFRQFMIAKSEKKEFEFIDFTFGDYSNLELRSQFISNKKSVMHLIKKKLPFMKSFFSK